METLQTSAYNPGNLVEASQRLERALESLETKIRALKAQAQLPQDSQISAEHHRLLGELEDIKAREKVLEQAANNAFEALGMAAANIRQILKEEAA